MSSNNSVVNETSKIERQYSLPTSKKSILSKTLSVSSQSNQKGENINTIEEIFSNSLIFLHAIYQLQLQRDASFLGKFIKLNRTQFLRDAIKLCMFQSNV